MKIAVIGTGHLADATREACETAGFVPVEADRADLVWFCVDTPVDAHDRPDMGHVRGWAMGALDVTLAAVPFLISSQVPVGFCAELEARYPDHHIAIQPENIRKAHALEDFRWQERMIVGARQHVDRTPIVEALRPFTNDIVFMSPESAEMVKHTLNTFLAMEIAFANEIADLCNDVKADVEDVSRGFRSDRRVGDGPLRPGDPYRGGTLGRDVHVLCSLGAGPLIRGVRESNTARL
jgi:UDPglucose 6-dehydrogenase